MTEYMKVRGNKDLVRQTQSSAILNTNLQELNKYKQLREEKLKLRALVEEQQKIRSDLDEIKSILYQLTGQSKP
jgi:predicted nuclease with TOPRIM domain